MLWKTGGIQTKYVKSKQKRNENSLKTLLEASALKENSMGQIGHMIN